MSTETSSDVKAIEHLDFRPTCKVRRAGGPQCGKPADYLCIKYCGCEALLCHSCMVYLVKSDLRFSSGLCGVVSDSWVEAMQDLRSI